MAGRIRIRLKAFDHAVIDQAAADIVRTAQKTGAQVSGPIPLPTKTRRWTVLRSPHVDKKSREQFELKTHKRVIDILGLVAPADRKAVYMGYAFLYGVIGSLLGSSFGAFLYARMMKPAIATSGAAATALRFWGLFAVLDVIAALGLIWFARAFGEDTPATRQRARAVMRGVYALVLLLGAGFVRVAFSTEPTQYRVLVNALIFIALGVFGLAMSRRK